jgi:hypothetical protein
MTSGVVMKAEEKVEVEVEQPVPAEQRAAEVLERIANDVKKAPGNYLRDTEVPEGGE